jgi:molybdopterin molybdotransferase
MHSCDCDSHEKRGPGLMALEQALEIMLAGAQPPGETEMLPVAEALGRVTARPVHSGIRVPSWDNSAMDGYAVRTADLNGPGSRLPVSARIPAGAEAGELEPGSAARIFTGAPVPAGADAVVIQEVCERDGDTLVVNAQVAVGANIRRAGEDIEDGQEIVPAGTRLRPQHLGLVASVGVAEIPVYRRLRVAVFASGDELLMPGQPLAPGKIYNSNLFMFKGLLQALGCGIVDLGVVEDDLEATKRALARGAAEADLVLASGGVSVGEEDHVKPAVEALGSLDLWKIAIRPGKPLAFGRIGDTPFIGSPGNPVSLFVTFCLFARPFILRSQGVWDVAPAALPARADFDWTKAEKRREFARARLRLDADGQAWVSLYPSRSSGVLSSVTWADGLAVLPENQTLAKGDPVIFLPFNELLT